MKRIDKFGQPSNMREDSNAFHGPYSSKWDRICFNVIFAGIFLVFGGVATIILLYGGK